MWFIQALEIVFHENVPEEVLELSCSWFLGIFEGITSNSSIPVEVIVMIHFSLNRAEKCSSIHSYLAFCILVFITYLFNA